MSAVSRKRRLMDAPLAIDLFCGLGGCTEGLMAEGYRVVGFDNERHVYGDARYPGQLVLQDVLALHGSQFKDAALIVASPPCQAYSYRAMPWKKAKALPPPDNTLFEACFRIQREACEAAGHHIPLVVENVCGAQKWIGRARWHFGSFYLLGDVPALMPITKRAKVNGTGSWFYSADNPDAFCWRKEGHIPPGVRSAEDDSILTGDGLARMVCAGEIGKATKNDGGSHEWNTGFDVNAAKVPGFRFDGSGKSFQTAATKVPGLNWSGSDKPGYKAQAFNSTAEQRLKATKNDGGSWFNASQPSISRMCGSKSSARKAASAHIAKIPYELARHIARAWKPASAEGVSA